MLSSFCSTGTLDLDWDVSLVFGGGGSSGSFVVVDDDLDLFGVSGRSSGF